MENKKVQYLINIINDMDLKAKKINIERQLIRPSNMRYTIWKTQNEGRKKDYTDNR